MVRYFKTLFSLGSLLAGLAMFAACSEQTFLTGPDDTNVSLHDTSSTTFLFKCYQVPPQIGKLSTLYLGEKDGYRMPFSLLRLPYVDLPEDTSISVDSAYVQMTLDSARSDDSVPSPELYLGYIEDPDTIFFESSSHYLNTDSTLEPNREFPSMWLEDSVQHVRFSLDPLLVESWIDTNGPLPQFMIKPSENLSGITAFYSRETTLGFPPILKVYYADTSQVIRFDQDMTLLIPPSLTGGTFDSTRIYAGRGSGLRSLIFTEVKSLAIPPGAVILRSYLSLPIDMDRNHLSKASSVKFEMNSLQDTVDDWSWGQILEEDTYDVSGRDYVPEFKDSTVTLQMNEILQSLVVDPSNNFGLKLTIESSPSLFDYVAFRSRGQGELSPRLEVLYATP